MDYAISIASDNEDYGKQVARLIVLIQLIPYVLIGRPRILRQLLMPLALRSRIEHPQRQRPVADWSQINMVVDSMASRLIQCRGLSVPLPF